MGAIWDRVVICTIDDIESEVGSLNTILQFRDSDKQGIADDLMAKTKREFSEMLKSSLPDIYARYPYSTYLYNDWLLYLGYTYLQTDNILDLIRPAAIDDTVSTLNPTDLLAAPGIITYPELTTTAVALFMRRALTKSITQFKASALAYSSPLESQLDRWNSQVSERWKSAKLRLFMDFAANGQVNDNERLRLRRGFQRG